MRQDALPFVVPSAVAAGIAMDVTTYVDKFVQVGGSFTATIEIQGRCHKEAPWFVVATVSAPGITPVPQSFCEMRINVTAWTSTPEVFLGAMNSRVD